MSNWKRHPFVDGERLRQLREERGLSQTAIAKAAGVTQTKVSQMERGKSRKGEFHSVILRLAAILEVSPKYLCGGPPTATDVDPEDASLIERAVASSAQWDVAASEEPQPERLTIAKPPLVAPEAPDAERSEAWRLATKTPPGIRPLSVEDEGKALASLVRPASLPPAAATSRAAPPAAQPRATAAPTAQPQPSGSLPRILDALDAAMASLAKLDAVLREEWGRNTGGAA